MSTPPPSVIRRAVTTFQREQRRLAARAQRRPYIQEAAMAKRQRKAAKRLKDAHMPSVSAKQQRAMQAAAHGHSTLGIPQAVGQEFVAVDQHKKRRGLSRRRQPGPTGHPKPDAALNRPAASFVQ